MSAKNHDVLVVGLGPAGASAAEAAAKAGARVLAVDRRRAAGAPVQCAEFVPLPLASETPAVAAHARQPIEIMRTYVLEESAFQTEGFRGSMIDRARFDAELVDRARAAGAICRLGVQVAGVDERGRVELSGGEFVRGRTIVGADGPRSRVGAAIGRVNRELLETRQFSIALRKPSLSTDIFLSAEIKGGYGWLFPKLDVANVGVGVLAKARARLKPLLDALHCRLVAEGLVQGEPLGWTGGHPGRRSPDADRQARRRRSAAGWRRRGAGQSDNRRRHRRGGDLGRLAGATAARAAAGDQGALDNYAEEIEDRFAASLARALRRRQEIIQRFHSLVGPSNDDLRRGWIAFPEYWAA